MRLVFRILVLLVIFTVEVSAAPAEVRIGAIASLTGPAAEQGESWLRGATLAIEELQGEGKSVKLIVEDDATNPAKVASAFKKLIDLDSVIGIIGGTWDYLGETAYPLAKQYRIPFITPSNPVEVLSETARSNPYVFSNGMTIRAEREAIQTLLKVLKVKRVTLIYPNLPFGEIHAEIFRDLARKGVVEIVYSNAFDYNSTYQDNLKVAALKSKQANSDLIYGVLDVGGIIAFLRELRTLRFESPLLVTQHLQQAFEQSGDRALFERVFAIYPKLGDDRFYSRYQARYGTAPRVFAANGYDAAKFLYHLLAQQVDLLDNTVTFEYDGVTAPHRLPTKNRGLVEDRALVMTTQSGSFAGFSFDEK